MDSLIYLALAVILFRGFAVEGYMISTGSMAPCLLGYHRQIVCPSCTFAFSRGTHFDEDASILAAGSPGSDLVGETIAPVTTCPNCGLETIDATSVPRNEGDQLLVHKHLYQLRSPRRWEIVVFRHPSDPNQAYVKRVVGLPGECIEVIDGDVYADAQLQRKPLQTQRSMRIPVYDHDCAPTDREWRPRWRSEDVNTWSPRGKGYVHRRGEVTGQATSDSKIHWLTYHHWVRGGGRHRTSVDLAVWPADVPQSRALLRGLAHDTRTGQLTFEGALSREAARRLGSYSNDPSWIAAVETLEQRSHESPIVDLYGYNHPESADAPAGIHDLMLEAVVPRVVGDGQWRMQISDGWHLFETVFDMDRREVSLFVDGAPEPLRRGRLSARAFASATTVEMSTFDRQVLVAIDGELPFEILPYSRNETSRQLTSTPVRVGARNVDLQVSHLRLYRDVHYTNKHAAGRDTAATLGPDEYYMLGDNSPVSVDSRSWPSPAIPRQLFIGKPFLVHLPSRQGRLEVAGSVRHIRIPDFSRVRYIY